MKIALIQSTLVWGDVKQNLVNFSNKISMCDDCDLILLPEMFTCGCMMVKRATEVVMEEKKRIAVCYDEIRSVMLAWAKQQQAVVMGSTVYECNEEYYNRLLIAFPDGCCQHYDKRHCFRMGGESEHFMAGDHQFVFQYKGVKIATFICYDLRFPVWSRNVQGYDLAVYVANWPESRREVWKTLLRARAIENQAFVAGVNCVGTDHNGLNYAGDSLVVDAWGQVVAACHEFKEETIVADIRVEELHAFRQKFAVLEDRDDFLILD